MLIVLVWWLWMQVIGLAALPLALEPIQRIRFIPYAHQRFRRFLGAYRARG